jgi:hypothetical protein
MSVADLKEAVIKLAAGEVETNEDETTKGKANVYPTPEGRKPGTLDALWGDAPPPPVMNSTGAMVAAKESREDMVERLFGVSPTSEQAVLKSLFNPETVRDAVTPHSATQRLGRTKTASDETLTDAVIRVTGLR